MSRKDSPPVFISSTNFDLHRHRQAAVLGANAASFVAELQENWTAEDHPPLEAWLECEEAERNGKHILAFLAQEGANWPDEHRDDAELRRAVETDDDDAWSTLSDEIRKRVKRLKAFKNWLESRGLRRTFTTEEELRLEVKGSLERWRRKHCGDDAAATEPTPRSGAESAFEVEHYRETAEQLHTHIELAGFKTRLRVPIDLRELYVPLHANVDLRGVGEADFADARDAETVLREYGDARDVALVEAFREAFQRKRRGLVILGDPGSGKTTHLKRVLLWCLREGPQTLGLEADILPVFLPLRELKDVSQGLAAFIESQLRDPHLQMPDGFGARLLERGRLLLLFDGLDEVVDREERAEVSRWVESAVKPQSTCVPVVTCRFAGYGGDARLGPEFLELHLRPPTREQSEAFIRDWYGIVETGLAPEPGQGERLAQERAEELISRLREPEYRGARLVEMTRNPLLLANLCLVHRDRGELPRGRAILYSECIDVLLELWRESKGIAANVTAEIGRRVLQPAALWLHAEEERTRASAEDLAPSMEPALKLVQWRGGTARDFLRTVRDESGLLTGWGQDQYGFMHLGFQEYLAASEIRRGHSEGERNVLAELATHYGQSWWQEVILLLLAQGNPFGIRPLYARGRQASTVLHRAHRIAELHPGRCRGDVGGALHRALGASARRGQIPLGVPTPGSRHARTICRSRDAEQAGR